MEQQNSKVRAGIRQRIYEILAALLPGEWFYAHQLTLSARRLLSRVLVALLGIAVAGVAVGLLNERNWPDVIAGALFAWSSSVLLWAVSSYKSKKEETSVELRRMAELDLLHARLNHLADKLNTPNIGLSGEIEEVLAPREERLAHFIGLDEFRPTGYRSGGEWWDSVALGEKDDG